MKKIIQKITYTFFAVFLCVLTLFNGGILTATAAETDGNKFDETNVLDDLRSSEGFNILKYPFYETATPEMRVINVVEYCYSFKANMRANYGLYLYVYNPNGQNIDTASTANTVRMAVAYDSYPITNESKPTAYEKFDLQFCNKAEKSIYKNLFYKFKVIDHESADGKTVAERVNSGARRYDISGFELLTYGSTNATDYTLGGSYIFTGYAAGYGSDTSSIESTLSCEVRELETIRLETTSTFYRTGEYKTNYQHDLTSVYFAVPETFFEKYGNLQKIKADWHEYVTTPIAITSKTEVYDNLLPWVGKNIGKFNDNVPLSLYTGYQYLSGSGGHYTKYDWVYNAHPGEGVRTEANTYCQSLNWLFSTNGSSISEYVLSAQRLQEYVNTYDKSNNSGYLPIAGKQINGDLFETGLSADRAAVPYLGNDIHHKQVNFDANDEFNMLNYDESNSGWLKFFQGLFGFAPSETDESYKGISPIHEVTAEDMAQTDIAKRLLIDGRDEPLQKFKDFYNTAVNDKKNPKRVILFRFAQTDFMRLPVMAYNNHTGTTLDKDYGKSTYVVQESVFYNFDILELTFNREGTYTVIPVVHNPIDIYNDITLPKIPDKPDWWKIVIGVVLLILLLVVLQVTGILPLIVHIVGWIVLLPFRLIGGIFKGIGNLFHKKD